MSGYMESIRRIRDGLLPFAQRGISVSHGMSLKKDLPKIIWMHGPEANQDLSGNDVKCAQVITGSVYYFTREEYDETVDEIQDTLSEIAGLSWALTEVETSEEGVWFYAWDWEMV